MYQLSDEQVLVVTDTLATTEDRPHMYVSKCAAIPHLELIVAYTGIAELGSRWVSMLHDRILCRDIEMLDSHAPEALQKIWSNLLEEYSLVGDITSTVYHFGRSEQSKIYMGIAYRSKEGFESEPLTEFAFGVKPHPEGTFETPTSMDETVALAARIRREQDRLHIGGALRLTAMTEGTIVLSELARFEDFDDMWQQMNDRL
jgi:hypothetical protein